MRYIREIVTVIATFSAVNLVNYLSSSRLDDKETLESIIQRKTFVTTEEIAQREIHVPPAVIETPRKPLVILLLSSSGRSGSTLLSHLLRTRGNSVLFFEPLFKTMNYKRDPCHLNGTCVSLYLKNIAECEYSQDFEDWFKKWTLFYGFYHLEVKTCLKYANDKDKCKKIDIRSRCRNSKVRIIKVIRSRLAWIEDLLRDDYLNVKLIYLTRDPRATLASFYHMGWKNSASDQCTAMKQDFQDFARFAKLYPGKIYRMPIETLGVNLEMTIEGLFDFLYGNREIYDEAEAFINEYMRAKKNVTSGMGLRANSTVEYQAWRWEISEKILSAAENDLVCQYVFNELGHTIFGSLTRARDKNVALLNFTNLS